MGIKTVLASGEEEVAEVAWSVPTFAMIGINNNTKPTPTPTEKLIIKPMIKPIIITRTTVQAYGEGERVVAGSRGRCRCWR